MGQIKYRKIGDSYSSFLLTEGEGAPELPSSQLPQGIRNSALSKKKSLGQGQGCFDISTIP